MARRIFCDKCGRELRASEAVQLLEYDLCFACCKKTLGGIGPERPAVRFQPAHFLSAAIAAS